MHKEVTTAQALAAVIENTGEIKTIEVTKMVSYRAPLQIIARVDAFAAQADKSRNYMMSRVIEAGFDAISENLSPETLDKINAREFELLSTLVAETTTEEH